MRWLLSRSPYLIVALAVAAGFLYVHMFGVNVVWNDEWDMASLFTKLSSGRLTVFDLWEPHNEHRFFFPSIAILLLGTLTKWNTVAEMYAIQACLLITLLALLVALRAYIGAKPLFFVPTAFLTFSLLQRFNMLWGLQLTFVFVETFAVVALFFLYTLGHGRFKWLAFLAALLSGTIAAFSVVQGLLVWPVGLLQLYYTPIEKAKKWLFLVLWGTIGVGEWVIYFIDYPAHPNSPSVFYPLTHPLTGARYFLTLLGTSLFSPRSESFAFASGLVLASLIVGSLYLTYRHRREGDSSFWLALLLYSLLVLAAITAGRSGAQDVPVQRYTNFSILVAVSVYALLAKSVLEERSRSAIAMFGTLCAVMLLSIPVSYYGGIKEGDHFKTNREQAAYVLSTYTTQSDRCLELLRRKKTDNLRRLAPQLEKLGYNVFAEPRVSPPAFGKLTKQCRRLR